jgi:hypothetical protein
MTSLKKYTKLSVDEIDEIKKDAFNKGRQSVFADIDELKNHNVYENDINDINDIDDSDDSEPELDFQIKFKGNRFSLLTKKIDIPSRSKSQWGSNESKHYKK